MLALMSFINDNFVNLISVMKAAVAKVWAFQNYSTSIMASSYKNKQMDLLAARIGSTVQLLTSRIRPTEQSQGGALVPYHERPVDGVLLI
ncbi:MAG: hypothetical protein ACLTQL_13085 [Eisenbergiella sp.]